MSPKKGLSPLCISADTEVLILGSLPSDESIRKQEYYGNPKNYFWDILSIVFGEAIGQDYESKREFLRRHHIALWDVIAEARREGSLDSNIRMNATMILNHCWKNLPSRQLSSMEARLQERSGNIFGKIPPSDSIRANAGYSDTRAQAV